MTTTLDQMIESLYDLDRAELRALAREALAISDGPDRPRLPGDAPEPGGLLHAFTIRVPDEALGAGTTSGAALIGQIRTLMADAGIGDYEVELSTVGRAVVEDVPPAGGNLPGGTYASWFRLPTGGDPEWDRHLDD